MRNVFRLAIILSLVSSAIGQEGQTRNPKTGVVNGQQVELPVIRRLPPKIGLRRAMSLAASQMKKQKLIVPRYYLVEAKYTTLSFEGKSVPCWSLLWIREDNQLAVGHDIEVYVFMDGKVWLPPVM
ncbi:MAG: hypothetical protein QOJ64_3602 [Acidobacteriota bacterium]|jgi:hypothetical protein|nr:hypothetical protein [Acidobacteriota bacterium]